MANFYAQIFLTGFPAYSSYDTLYENSVSNNKKE
jgi:hypothetical protein